MKKYFTSSMILAISIFASADLMPTEKQVLSELAVSNAVTSCVANIAETRRERGFRKESVELLNYVASTTGNIQSILPEQAQRFHAYSHLAIFLNSFPIENLTSSEFDCIKKTSLKNLNYQNIHSIEAMLNQSSKEDFADLFQLAFQIRENI